MQCWIPSEWLERYGVPVGPGTARRPNALDPKLRARVLELLRRGVACKRIKALTGVSGVTITKLRKELEGS
jgi:hypothetical protein